MYRQTEKEHANQRKTMEAGWTSSKQEGVPHHNNSNIKATTFPKKLEEGGNNKRSILKQVDQSGSI